MKLTVILTALFATVALGPRASAQSADWTEGIWREPQVRYLLADLTLNGGVANTGWIDLLTGINAFKRRTGEYLVFVEENYKAKSLIYRWKP